MELGTIFSTAKELAEKVKQEKPCFAELEAAVIIDGKGTAFLGVTGVGVKDGALVDVPADVAAFLNMKNAGSRIAAGMAVVKLTDMSFTEPSAEALELMFRANADNDGCTVCLGEGESKALSALRLGGDSASLMDGFDFGGEPAPAPKKAEPAAPAPEKKPAPAAAPAQDGGSNTISGVTIDESNPFYEAPSDVTPVDDTIAVMSEESKTDTLKDQHEEPELTPEELLKQAKKRKKVAKSNFLFRKRN